MKDEKGFSLVEMAIALVVLAVIAGVVYLAAQPYVSRSAYTADGQQLEAIRGAITSFYGDQRKHPCKSPVCTTGGWTDLLPYMPKSPDTSRWNATCTDGGNLDITVSSDQVANTQAQFQNQCSTVLTDNTAKTVTCRLTTTARCP